MVQGKKPNDMSNGATKYQNNMSFQKKDRSESRGGAQNGFRTDSAISGSKIQGERTLQRWVPDAPEEIDGSLESGKPSSGPAWDQFAGTQTDYDENIYTTKIDTSHPHHQQRIAYADRKAREIERSVATNSHVAEERIADHVKADSNGLDEEDKYSGVRRQQDFPPLTSSSNKYQPPARRGNAGQTATSAAVSTVASNAPGILADPAILASGRPKATSEKKNSPVQKPKAEVAPPPTVNEPSATATPDTKVSAPKATASAGRTIAQPKPQASPNATATVERDVASAFKTFANQQRKNLENARANKARNDKEFKLNDLKKFAEDFKLNTPVPQDLVPIIAKDPAKQKEIMEKSNRSAEEAKLKPAEAVKPVQPPSEARAPASQRPAPAAHAPSPSSNNNPSRQASNRQQGFSHQQGYNNSQSFRGNQSSQAQPQMPPQQGRGPGNLGTRLKNLERQNLNQGMNNMPLHDARHPPTGPANPMDPNFSRRSSGVTSAQGGRLNPNSSEFRPNAHAPTFTPNGNPSHSNGPSSGSSPAINASVEQSSPAPVARSLLKRKPVSPVDRPSLKEKFNALEHIMTIKPLPEQNWEKTGGMRPSYDTPPIWRQLADGEPDGSSIHLTYTKLFEMTPFPTALSPPNLSHAVPPVPHQHQLPFHLQQGVHMNQRQSPRAMPMNLPGNQHGHGPAPQFSGPDEHRMMPSHSAQSFASPRPHNAALPFPSPMGTPMSQNAQLYAPQMMPYGGVPPMAAGYRSLSQNQHFVPQQQMGPPMMMQNPTGGFMTTQGMPPGGHVMYPQGPQGHFMPQGSGHPPAMPVNGYPSPGRGAPMMMSQGSQQGHQQPPMFAMNPGMSPGPQYGNAVPVYAQQPPGQIPMRPGYNGGPGQFGTSPQQPHQFAHQQRNNHQNGNFNNNKNFQHPPLHPNAPPNSQPPNGTQPRVVDGVVEEAK
ncbi:hypothetical protein HYALB_00000594 [Hymenoscyphus albidus]|uniref:LsmAD domain-containing protein n=1 Tax=Hymenoscyphus albidus TaxID=595503 RepID=A0A9N9M2D8_9HELO|nr:hypothetical protein HYALB_00000594 [Hymenoscyphus albidus]